MRYPILALFCLITIGVFAQSNNALPEVTVSDLKATKCSLDSSANAAILYNAGNLYFWEHNDRFEYVLAKTTRIKVYNKEGYQYAKFNLLLSYNGLDSEKLIEFKATSYTLENGKVVKKTVGKKSLLVEDVNKGLTNVKLAFPNIQEGSIVEYTYKVTSPFVMHLTSWYFQYDIPVLKSRLKFTSCPFYNYVYLVNRGNLNFSTDTSYSLSHGFKAGEQTFKTTVYEWELDSIPAFVAEPYLTTPDDYLLKVDFQLQSYYYISGEKFEVLTTWKQMIDELLQSYNAFIKSDKKEIKSIINNLFIEDASTTEKAKTIWRYVNSNFYYNHFNGGQINQQIKGLVKSKTGNAAEINLFLISLLREAGIKANPLLLSTRSHGKLYYQYPLLSRFNYLTVLVHDSIGDYYLDATNPFLPFGLLPQKCINGYGLEIKWVKKNDDVKFYPLTPTISDRTKIQTFIRLDKQSDSLTTKLLCKYSGYEALNYRKMFVQNKQEPFFNEVVQNGMMSLKEMKIENLNKPEKDLTVKMNISQPAERAGNKILISPLLYNPYTENVLKLKNRNYPIDFGFLSDEHFNVTIALPQGYQVDYTPTDTSFFACDSTLSFKLITQTSKAYIQMLFVIKRSKLKYEPISYQALKQFYEEVVALCNKKIIISETPDK